MTEAQRQTHKAATAAHRAAANAWHGERTEEGTTLADSEIAAALTQAAGRASRLAEKHAPDADSKRAARRATRQDAPSDEASDDHAEAAQAHERAANRP